MQTPSIEKKVREIRTKIWIIVAASATPLIFFTIVKAWKTHSQLDLVQSITISFFVLGIGLIAAKLISHMYVIRNLHDIQDLDKAKSDFISIASHQLKSPVTSLKWALEDLKLSVEDKDWPQVTEKTTMLEDSVEHLVRLTRDLLDVSHIDAQQFAYTPKDFDPEVLIKNVIKDLEPLASKNTHNLVYTPSPVPLTVVADESLFNNVIQNLISNAIYYSLPSTIIEVKTETDGLLCKISVTNTSVPLSESDRSKLFEKFYRSEFARKVRQDGTGLGLTIVKAYIEKWGGQIAVHTEPTGIITFSFTIPLKTV